MLDLKLNHKVKYLYLLSVAIASATVIYFLKNKYQFNHSEYDGLFFVFISATFLTIPIYHFTRRYVLAAAWLFFWALVDGTFNFYLGGGLKAPGIFWVCMFPLVGGLLFETKGVILGAICNFAILIFLGTPFAQVPWEPLWTGVSTYQRKKLFSLFVFSLYNMGTTLYFVMHEKKQSREIKELKDKLDGLLGVIIHDIATPLNILHTNIELLKRNPNNNFEKRISLLDRHSVHLINILEQVRTMKAVSDGKLFPKFTIESAQELLQEAVDLYKERAQDKSVTVELTLPEFGADNIFVDRSFFISTVLGNILSNAIKFSPKGGKISALIAINQGRVEFCISDEGQGMPKAILENLFNPHSSTTRPGTQGEKGTGFGMLLMKQWTEAMHGVVKVQSTEGADHGTTFVLSFPLNKNGKKAA